MCSCRLGVGPNMPLKVVEAPSLLSIHVRGLCATRCLLDRMLSLTLFSFPRNDVYTPKSRRPVRLRHASRPDSRCLAHSQHVSMCDPITWGTIFASIGSAFRLADLAIRIAEVGSENDVFVSTIQIVRDDLNEVERLLNLESVQRKLSSIPSKLGWVQTAVVNTKSALDDIAKWVERARSEQEAKGRIHFHTRVKWVINDHEKLMNRTARLNASQQQLLNVSSYLAHLEEIPKVPAFEIHDTTFFNDVLLRHKKKKGYVPPMESVEDMETPARTFEPDIASQ